MTPRHIAATSSPSSLHPLLVTGAQYLALGGIAFAAITAAVGLAGAPWTIAGVVMIAANLAALLAERRR